MPAGPNLMGQQLKPLVVNPCAFSKQLVTGVVILVIVDVTGKPEEKQNLPHHAMVHVCLLHVRLQFVVSFISFQLLS